MSEWKKKSLNYENGEKQTLELSIWVNKWQNLFFFKSHVFVLEDVISFLGTTKKSANDSFLSCSKSYLKVKSLKYEKCEKLIFEISN